MQAEKNKYLSFIGILRYTNISKMCMAQIKQVLFQPKIRLVNNQITALKIGVVLQKKIIGFYPDASP